MVEFVMPTCAALVEQLHALRRDILTLVEGDAPQDRARAVRGRFDRLIARYEDHGQKRPDFGSRPD